jgi:5-methylcytosine-specific restriction endonuclease McrA
MFGNIWMKFLIKRIKGMVARIFRRRMKKQISAALRQQVWIKHKNKIFESDCSISWCKNIINVFNFQCGHNIPESKGGATNINNLYPICMHCNQSMGDRYTIDEWNKLVINPNCSPTPIPKIDISGVSIPVPVEVPIKKMGCFSFIRGLKGE